MLTSVEIRHQQPARQEGAIMSATQALSPLQRKLYGRMQELCSLTLADIGGWSSAYAAAILAQAPGVAVETGPIRLRWRTQS